MEKAFLSVTEFGQIYGLKKTKTFELIKNKAFDTVKIGRSRRIVAASAAAWAASLLDAEQ